MFVDVWDEENHIGRGAIDLEHVRRVGAIEEWVCVYDTASESPHGLLRVGVEHCAEGTTGDGGGEAEGVEKSNRGDTSSRHGAGDGSLRSVDTDDASQSRHHDDLSATPAVAADTPPLPPHWETAVSRSTGRQYFVNTITGESQYETPDASDELITTHFAAKIIQDAWRARSLGNDADGARNSALRQNTNGEGEGADQIGQWEEVDLTFDTEGALGLVFSSETETAAKVVTEVVPGKLASQVPELASAFDTDGKPMAGQAAIALIEVQGESVERMSFSEAVSTLSSPGALDTTNPPSVRRLIESKMRRAP